MERSEPPWNDGGLTTPKSGKGRRVDLSQQLTKTLRAWLVRSEAQKLRKGWKELPARVFSNENGNLPDPENFRCSFFSASSRDDGGAHHPSRSDGLFLSLPGAPHQ